MATVGQIQQQRVTHPQGVKTALSKDALLGVLFAKRRGNNLYFSDLPLNMGFSIGNNGGFARGLTSLMALEFSYLGEDNPAQFLTSEGMDLSNQALGLTSSMYALLGPVYAKQLYDKMCEDGAIGDHRGRALNGIGLGRSVVLGAGGVAGGAIGKTTRIAAILTGSTVSPSAPSLLGRVSFGAGLAGTALFALYYLLGILTNSMRLYWGEKFASKLHAKATTQEKIAYLKGRLEASPERLVSMMKKKYGSSEEITQEYIREAIAFGSKNLAALLEEAGSPVSEDRAQELFAAIIQENNGLNPMLEVLGIGVKLNHLASKKEAKLIRLMGESVVTKLKALGDNPSLEQMESILSDVESALTTNRKTTLIRIGVLTVAVTGLIAATIFTAGLAAIVAAGIVVLSYILMWVLDNYGFKESLERVEKIGKWDKGMAGVSLFLSLASTGFVVGLMVSGVISFGAIPLATALVLGIFWMAESVIAYRGIAARDRRFKESNPTLSDFIEALKHEGVAHVGQLFKKLPKEVQKELHSLFETRHVKRNLLLKGAEQVDARKRRRLNLVARSILTTGAQR